MSARPSALRKAAGIETRFFASTLLSNEERNMLPNARFAPFPDGIAPQSVPPRSPFRGGARDTMGPYGKQRDVSPPLTFETSANGTNPVDR